MADEPMQYGRPLDAPDATRPSWRFRDGRRVYCVSSLHVAVPTWGTRGTGTDLQTFVLLFIVCTVRAALWRTKDDRYKIVVSRARHRWQLPWRTVDIDFFDDQEQSDRRQVELVRGWVPGRYENSEALGWRERRRRRLASLSSRSGH